MKHAVLALGAVVLGLMAVPASAQELIDSYQAFLSQSNHYNSNGQRLTSAAQIIRQDRADLHRFGIRDPGDQDDTFFANADNRAALERLIDAGDSDPRDLRRIVNSNVTVEVDIYESDGDNYAFVTVLD